LFSPEQHLQYFNDGTLCPAFQPATALLRLLLSGLANKKAAMALCY